MTETGTSNPTGLEAYPVDGSLSPESEPTGRSAKDNYDAIVGFIGTAFAEAQSSPPQERLLRGSHYADFNNLLGSVTKQLRELDPELPLALLMSQSYVEYYMGREGREAQLAYLKLSDDTKAQVDDLRRQKNEQTALLIDEQIEPALASQTLEPGLLNIPPYCPQGADFTAQTCVNASFRMLYAAIAGERLSQDSVLTALRRQLELHEHQMPLLHNEEYLAILQTSVFRERYGKTVRTLSLRGVDFNNIAAIITRLRLQKPGLHIYCMVSLTSDSAAARGRGIWHSAILLHGSKRWVVVHDPSLTNGARARIIPKADFTRRWGEAFLTGQLVVVE